MATFQKIISEDSSGVVSVSSKLGVGTSSPAKPLSINHDSDVWKVAIQHNGTERLLIGTGTSTQTISTANASNNLDFSLGGSTKMRMVGTSGNFGIGTSSPRGRLDVLGTLGSQGFYVTEYGGAVGLPTDIVHSSGAGTFDIQVRNYRLGTSTGGDISIYPKHGTNSLGLGTGSYQNRFFINGVNGNIGIGTTSPDTALHIKGTSPHIKTEVSSGNNFSGIEFFDNDSTSSGKIGTFGHTGGNIYLQQSSGNTAIFSDSGITFTRDLKISNQAPYVRLDDTQGGVMQLQSNAGDIRIRQNSTGDNPTTDTIYVTNTGKVGIGYSASNQPTEKLQVDGNITSSGIIRAEGTSGLILGPELGTSTTRFGVFGHGNGLIAGGDGNLYFAPRNVSSGNGSYIILGQRASTNNKGNVRIVAGSNGVNGQTGDLVLTSGAGTKFHMDGDTGNIGIGATNPIHGQLEVRGVANDTTIAIHEDDGTHKAQLHLRSGGNDVKLYQSGTDNKFHIDTESVSKAFTLATDGKVGIATDSPSEKLHVNGNIKVEGGETYYDVYKGPRTTGEYLYLTSTRGISFIDHGAGTMGTYDGSHRKIYLGTSAYHMNTFSYGDINLPLDASNTSHKIKLTGLITSEIYTSSYDAYWSTSLNHYLVSRDGFIHRNSDSSKMILFKHDINNNHHIVSNMSDFSFLAGHNGGSLGFCTIGSTSTYKAIQSIFTDNNNVALKFNTKVSGTDTERIRITTAGLVGIGTSSPSTSLEISGGANKGIIVDSTSGVSYITARKDGNQLMIGADGTSGFIKYGNTTTSLARDLRFFEGGGSEVMRLDDSGRLMIGTTTASGTLTVDPDENSSTTFGKAKFYSAVSDYMYLSHFDYATMSNYAVKQAPTGSTTINAPSGQTVGLGINNSNKLTVSATGKVGIGTSSPGQTLHVDGNIRVGDSNDYIFSNKFAGLSSALVTIQSSPSNDIAFNAGGAETVRFTSDGKVGIGTTSPTQIFNVRDSANSLDLFSIRSTGSETRIGIGKSSADCAIDFSTGLPNGGGTIANTFRINYINNVRTASHNGRLVLQSNNGIRIAGYNDNPSGNAYGLEVKHTRDSDTNTNDYILHVMKKNTNNDSVFKVKANGWIGINEDNPQANLHINDGGSGNRPPIVMFDGYYSYQFGAGNMHSDVDPNNNGVKYQMSSTKLYTDLIHGSGQWIWRNNNGANQRMRLDNSGRLGLGLNTTPAHILDIRTDNSAGTIVQLRDTGDDYPVGITYNHGVSGHHYAWYAGTMDGTSGERKFTIGTKVSDGFHNDLTTSSYSLLELNQMDSSATHKGPVDIRKSGSNARHADTALMITNTNAASMTAQMEIMSGNAGYSNIYLGDTNSYSQGGFVYEHFSDKLYFRTSNATKMTLHSTGLGIGTMSPAYKLDLVDGMRINRSSNDPYIIFARGGTSLSQIRGVNGGGINITDGGSGNSRIYVNSSGNVGIANTSPTTLLDVGGSFKVQGTAEFQDTVSFEGDVDFTNASIEGLPNITVSPTTVFKCATTATNINFGVSLTKGDILFGTPSTENGTYISHTDDDEKITLKRAGEYEISITLVVTAQSASNRFTCLTYVEHYNSSNTLLDSFGLEAMYIRSNGTNYNSGAMAGQIRITTGSMNTWVKVTSMVLDRESSGTVPLNTTYSKIRIDKIDYNQ